MVVRIPGGLYFELLKQAREHRVSVQQLALELMRNGLLTHYGYQCPHDEKDRKFSRKSRQWYCANCYTFLDNVPISGKSGLNLVPRKSSWEIKREMSAEEWSKMVVADNTKFR